MNKRALEKKAIPLIVEKDSTQTLKFTLFFLQNSPFIPRVICYTVIVIQKKKDAAVYIR